MQQQGDFVSGTVLVMCGQKHMQQQGDFVSVFSIRYVCSETHAAAGRLCVSGTVLVMCGQKHMQQQGDFVSVYNISCVLRNTCSSRETL